MEIIKVLLVGILRLLYFLPVLALIILLVLLFGHPILGPGLAGTDNANFIVLANWLYKWFPEVPFWFPQQGGGMSFTASYPILSHLIIVFFSKIFGLSLPVVFRIYALVVIVLTSVGIYFLSLRFTKSQTISLLASIFYPLSPIAWIFLFEWGFFAEHASYLFVPPAIIFFELYLSSKSDGSGFTKRLYLFIFVFLSILILLSHVLIFLGLLVFLIPLIFTYSIFVLEDKRGMLVKSLGTSIAVAFLLISISLFWVVPYLQYQKAVKEGSTGEKYVPSREFILQNSVYPLNFFNISTKYTTYLSLDDKIQPFSNFVLRNVSFPFAISLLFFIGFIGAYFLNKKVFSLTLAALPSMVAGLSPEFLFWLFKTPVLDYFSGWRSLLLSSRFVIPIVAAFGCYVLARLILLPLKKFLSPIFSITVPLAVTLVALGTLYFFKNWPGGPSYLISYGPEVLVEGRKFDSRDIWKRDVGTDICAGKGAGADYKLPEVCFNETLQTDFWLYRLRVACQKVKQAEANLGEFEDICLDNPPKDIVKKVVKSCESKSFESGLKDICEARVRSVGSQILPRFSDIKLKDTGNLMSDSEAQKLLNELLGYLPKDSSLRLDVDTSLGLIFMAEPYYSDMPEMQVYYNQSSLIPMMWNYQTGSFYNKNFSLKNPQTIDELSKYFGIGYVILSEEMAPLDRYNSAIWTLVGKVESNKKKIDLIKLEKAKGILDVTTRPLVLILGQRKVHSYFRIFRLANLGGIPYEEAIVVDGGESVETYSNDQLRQFDAVIMDGYQYKDRAEAWKLLDGYVKNGGSLYINTGWQYTSADWELDKTPDFFPISSLGWTNIGKNPNLSTDDSQIGGKVDLKHFSPFVFDDSAWGISTGNLRDWARVILSADGKPLVAGGNYGSGRVIWTGIDLAGHIASYGDNPEEVNFFHSLLKYLVGGREAVSPEANFVRKYPDRVEILIPQAVDKKTAIFWKEAYYKNFKAKVEDTSGVRNIATYKAGPGFTLMILPKMGQNTKVTLEYVIPAVNHLVFFFSFSVVLLLFLNIFKPELNKNLQSGLHKIVKFFGKISLGKTFSTKDEENNY